MPTIKVLKPFTFSHPPTRALEKLTTETKFVPGVHDVTEEVANHPWILSGADGKVQTAAQAKVQAEIDAKKAKEAAAEADIANAQAQAAAARLQKAEPTKSGSAEELEEELNTPVNKLREKQPPLGIKK